MCMLVQACVRAGASLCAVDSGLAVQAQEALVTFGYVTKIGDVGSFLKEIAP